MDWLKNLLPTHEPVAYLVIALVCYQLFIQKQPIDDKWLQYVIELVLGAGARQIVKPMAKIKEEGNGGN